MTAAYLGIRDGGVEVELLDTDEAPRSLLSLLVMLLLPRNKWAKTEENILVEYAGGNEDKDSVAPALPSATFPIDILFRGL